MRIDFDGDDDIRPREPVLDVLRILMLEFDASNVQSRWCGWCFLFAPPCMCSWCCEYKRYGDSGESGETGVCGREEDVADVVLVVVIAAEEEVDIVVEVEVEDGERVDMRDGRALGSGSFEGGGRGAADEVTDEVKAEVGAEVVGEEVDLGW